MTQYRHRNPASVILGLSIEIQHYVDRLLTGKISCGSREASPSTPHSSNHRFDRLDSINDDYLGWTATVLQYSIKPVEGDQSVLRGNDKAIESYHAYIEGNYMGWRKARLFTSCDTVDLPQSRTIAVQVRSPTLM